MPYPSYSLNISYKLSPSVQQAFWDVHFEGVRDEVCETFASRWGGLDLDAFQRAFTQGQGDDKCLAIFALGLNAPSEMTGRLLFLLSSSETPRLERWASALCLGRIKEQQAYPYIETLLLDGLSIDEYKKAELPSEENLSHELWVCTIWRHELVLLLKDWTSPSLPQTLRQVFLNALELEKVLHRSIISYDEIWYILGINKAFGALSGINIPSAYWKTAIVYMSLGSFHAQDTWTKSLESELASNLIWQQKVSAILAEQFGLSKEEQDDCIHRFSFYIRIQSTELSVNASEKEPTNESLADESDDEQDFFEDDDDEEDETAFMIPAHQICLYSGHTARITSLSWTPDGKYVASGSEDGTVQVWDSQSGKPYLTFKEHRASIKAAIWSPQGNLVASGGNDCAVRVWDARTGEQIWEGTGHSAWICDLAWSPDGTRIASVALDKTVRVWDVFSKRLTRILRGHEAVTTSVAWSPDGKHLVSGSGYPECLIYVWNAITGEQELVHQWHTYDEKRTRLLPPWARKEESLDEEYRKASTVHYLSWSPDGRLIASAGNRFVCLVWDATTGENVIDVYRTNGPVTWSSDSANLFWFPNGAREIEVWDVPKNALKVIYQLDSKHFISVFRVSPDGKYVAADDETRIGIWKLK